MTTRACLQILCSLVVTLCLVTWACAGDKTPTEKPHAQKPTSQPAHERLGKMPLSADQTINRQNSPQDKLRIDITKSQAQGDKFVSYVRIAWGDLDNLIKGGGKQYYSDWDGQLSLAAGTAVVVHEIAFDDGKGHPTTRPAGTHVQHHATTTRPTGTGAAHHHKPAAGAKEPGPGSGRDELENTSGNPIAWKAGVVGAYDGLLIKITSDTATPGGTIKAGKFSVSFKVNAAAK